MFSKISYFLALVAFSTAFSTPQEEQMRVELKSAGMSDATLNGLDALNTKFKEEYPKVAADKDASGKFLEAFRIESDNFLAAMPATDKAIYDAFVQKKGKEAFAELKTAGMSQSSIDGLTSLTNKFTEGYPKVSSNKEAADKFSADFQVESENFLKSMPPTDQAIYKEYLKKQGVNQKK